MGKKKEERTALKDLIGETVVYIVGELQVKCKVLEVVGRQRSFGHERLLLTPIAGAGKQMVDRTKTIS